MWNAGSSPPCASMNPERAWKIGSKPGSRASGPVEPYPLTDVCTSRGFVPTSVSQPTPSSKGSVRA